MIQLTTTHLLDSDWSLSESRRVWILEISAKQDGKMFICCPPPEHVNILNMCPPLFKISVSIYQSDVKFTCKLLAARLLSLVASRLAKLADMDNVNFLVAEYFILSL